MNISQNVEVADRQVLLGDIAEMTCADKAVAGRLKAMNVIHVKEKKFGRYIVSTLAIIEKIHEIYPQLDINSIGEPEFVLTYREPQKKSFVLEAVKICFVCLTAFLGSAFTIMTFNNDVGVPEVFEKIYQEVTGETSSGFTILEIAYSIGIAVGITVFFNHFFGRKLTTDPTPIEVEMKTYEQEVNTMLINSCTRGESKIDVR